MLTLKDLTNDTKRKQFYQKYEENFNLLHIDKYNGFKYYGFDFEDGSFLTALEYNHDLSKSGPHRAIITLTRNGENYRPIASNMTDIVAHLKNY